MAQTVWHEVNDWRKNRQIKVAVTEPVTITTKELLGLSTSFTTYMVKIQTNHWAFSLPCTEVRRRFSEFCWLREKLAYHHPNKVLPTLPNKTFFHVTRCNPAVIQHRCASLGKFLQRVMRSTEFLSDAALHLFLQSNLSTSEMNNKISEEFPIIKSNDCPTPILRRCWSYSSIGSEAYQDYEEANFEFTFENSSDVESIELNSSWCIES